MEAQRGFRSHMRCSDQWLVLRGVCELRKREKKTSYLAFLDVTRHMTVCGGRDCGVR